MCRVFAPVCDLDKEVSGSYGGCLVGFLGASISRLGCLGSSLEDLVVVQFLL